MFAACCCANDGSGAGDRINDRALVQEFPKEDVPFPEAPKVLQGAGDSSAQDASSGKKENGTSEFGPGTTFTTTISRNEEEPIGLDIDLIDGISAVVVDIKDGAVKSWNEKNPAQAIRVNDRIVQVNGAKLEANALVANLKTETLWVLEVQRPVLFTVCISRADAPSLGMDLRYAPNGTTLMITQIGEGPMQDWNRAHPKEEVCRHDRIIQLNGVKGTPTMLLQASADSETLHMVILHFPQVQDACVVLPAQSIAKE